MKRSRTGRDAGSDLSELLAAPVSSSSSCDESGEVAWSTLRPTTPTCTAGELSRAATSPAKRVRTSQLSSAGVSSPTARSSASPPSARAGGDSVGGDELDLLRRKDEEVADMAIFLARAAAETASHASFDELVSFLEHRGVTRAALALRRVGGLAVFVERLCGTRDAALRRVALRLLLCLIELAEAEALFQECVVAFLVDCLEPGGRDGAASAPAPAAPPVRASHWSQRRKTAAAPQSSPQPATSAVADSLEARAAGLCPSASPSLVDAAAESGAVLSMRALLGIVFAHNSGSAQLAAHHGTPVPLAFARLGGLDKLSGLLTASDARGSALALLEVLTATPTLGREAERLLALVPALVALIYDRAVQVPALRVLTNVTNVLPHALRATRTTAVFAEFALDVLALHPLPHTDSREDLELFTLCCAINVVRNESTASTGDAPAEFASALAAFPEALDTFAEAMVYGYDSSDTGHLICSGYYALLLCALSLAPVVVDGQPTTLRVPVMTAVAKASAETRLRRAARHKPMGVAIVIVQELANFQSSAGIMTREAWLAMHELVVRVARNNQIPVSPRDGSDRDDADDVDDDDDDDDYDYYAYYDDDHDDVVLAELL